MPTSDDDLHAQEPTPVSHPGRPEDDQAKADFDASTQAIGDTEPADAVDDSDPESPNAE